jgi:hypothetical protein
MQPRELSPEILALAAEGLRRGGLLRLQVRGVSMLPSVWPGDTVEVAGCSLEDIRSEEVVLAFGGDGVVLHRFLGRCREGGFLLRGDSMAAADPIFPASAFLGRLVQITRAGRTVPAPMRLRSWSRALGLLFYYCDVGRRLALEVHKWRISRAHD